MPVQFKTCDRIDYMPFSDEGPEGSWMVEKMAITDEGYLKGRAIATNVGVFTYMLADGTIQRELRSAEEVFHPDSVASLVGKVLTDNHPAVKVTSENSKELAIGFTGDIRQDQYHLAPALTFTDKAVVLKIDDGKRALSCGYTTDLVMESGTWLGMDYDAIQTNIRYNHVALVDKGRAGDAAVLKLDSMDSLGIQVDKKDEEEESVTMPKFTVDNVEYEVDAAFIAIYKAKEAAYVQDKKESETALTAAKAETSTVQAKADQMEEDNTKLKADLKEAEKGVSKEAMDEAIATKLNLLTNAEKAGVEVTADMDDTMIMKEIVIALSPSAKDKVDKCDDAYLQIRFDLAIEKIKEDEEDDVLEGDTLADKKKVITKDGADARTADQHRQDMIDYNKNRSQEKKEV